MPESWGSNRTFFGEVVNGVCLRTLIEVPRVSVPCSCPSILSFVAICSSMNSDKSVGVLAVLLLCPIDSVQYVPSAEHRASNFLNSSTITSQDDL